MNKYICKICATIYDPDLGDEEDGIMPGTPFEELPNDWTCDICGSPKDKFEVLSQEEYERITKSIRKAN